MEEETFYIAKYDQRIADYLAKPSSAVSFRLLINWDNSEGNNF